MNLFDIFRPFTGCPERRILRAARKMVTKSWVGSAAYRAGAQCAAGAVYDAAIKLKLTYRKDEALLAFIDANELKMHPDSLVIPITRWNDRFGRTQAEVIAAFRKAEDSLP